MIKEDTNTSNSGLTNRIKKLRASLNLSQEELANKVNVRRETIVHLENNKYNPSLKLALEISNVFGLKIEDVFGLIKGNQ
jgi:putative transcriptional regulator